MAGGFSRVPVIDTNIESQHPQFIQSSMVKLNHHVGKLNENQHPILLPVFVLRTHRSPRLPGGVEDLLTQLSAFQDSGGTCNSSSEAGPRLGTNVSGRWRHSSAWINICTIALQTMLRILQLLTLPLVPSQCILADIGHGKSWVLCVASRVSA